MLASHHDSLGLMQGQVMWDLWWTKWHCGRFSLSVLVPPARSPSTDCFMFINHSVINAI
jgi:hypothetical protein